MTQIFSTFGLDWRLLIINSVNFALVLVVLWYFFYTPVVRMLDERRQKVAKGVADAEAAEAKLAEIHESRAEVLAAAGREADEVIAHARRSGAETEKAAREHGEAQAAAALKEAGMQAQELKEQALEEAKRETAKLIVLGVEKTLAQQHQ